MKKMEKIIYTLCFVKMKIFLNNFFVTIVNSKGEVLITQSAGNLSYVSKTSKKRIPGKEKKTSYTAVKVLKDTILLLKTKNIYVKMMILQSNNIFRINHHVFFSLKELVKLQVNVIIFIDALYKIKHGSMKKKKLRKL